MFFVPPPLHSAKVFHRGWSVIHLSKVSLEIRSGRRRLARPSDENARLYRMLWPRKKKY